MSVLNKIFTGTSIFAIIAYAVLMLAGIYGWVVNVVMLCTSYSLMSTNEFILRLVGVPVAILGAVMGYIK